MESLGQTMKDSIPGRFKDQVALVVGGAQGIGKAIAVRLAREGARLVIADIDRPMMARTEKEVRTEGGNVRTLYCDVRKKRLVDAPWRRSSAGTNAST